MPRFVILHHQTPPEFPRPSHWDCMLEVDSVLATWSLPELPNGQAQQMTVEQLADHRADYLQYEGPISQNRGTVDRVDSGEFRWRTEPAQRQNVVEVELDGQTLSGVLMLTRIANTSEWLFQFTPSSVR